MDAADIATSGYLCEDPLGIFVEGYICVRVAVKITKKNQAWGGRIDTHIMRDDETEREAIDFLKRKNRDIEEEEELFLFIDIFLKKCLN